MLCLANRNSAIFFGRFNLMKRIDQLMHFGQYNIIYRCGPALNGQQSLEVEISVMESSNYIWMTHSPLFVNIDLKHKDFIPKKKPATIIGGQNWFQSMGQNESVEQNLIN